MIVYLHLLYQPVKICVWALAWFISFCFFDFFVTVVTFFVVIDRRSNNLRTRLRAAPLFQQCMTVERSVMLVARLFVHVDAATVIILQTVLFWGAPLTPVFLLPKSASSLTSITDDRFKPHHLPRPAQSSAVIYANFINHSRVFSYYESCTLYMFLHKIGKWGPVCWTF